MNELQVFKSGEFGKVRIVTINGEPWFSASDVGKIAGLMVGALDGTWEVVINPLGDWTGGTDVDTGATNRKLGSDMGDAVTGGGLHGKDLSKADVSVNIMCHKLAQELKREVSAFCAIGDEQVTFHISETDSEMVFSYDTVVGVAREYIKTLGGFERFAEWGLID